MLEARRRGRPGIAWALDVAVVVLAIVLLIVGDQTIRLLGVLMLVWRAVSVALAVAIWRRTAEGRQQR